MYYIESLTLAEALEPVFVTLSEKCLLRWWSIKMFFEWLFPLNSNTQRSFVHLQQIKRWLQRGRARLEEVTASWCICLCLVKTMFLAILSLLKSLQLWLCFCFIHHRQQPSTAQTFRNWLMAGQ